MMTMLMIVDGGYDGGYGVMVNLFPLLGRYIFSAVSSYGIHFVVFVVAPSVAPRCHPG